MPHFFTTTQVNLQIKSELLEITQRKFLPLTESYLTELLISGLLYWRIGVFRGCPPRGGLPKSPIL